MTEMSNVETVIETVSDDKKSNEEKSDIKISIYVTKDYDKFKIIKNNRLINRSNYARLYNNIEKKQLKIPILVNEKMEIIDGQHRYKILKELGKPIYYYIVPGYSIQEVKLANMVSCTWKKQDFLHMYLEDKKDAYLAFNEIMDQYKIPLSLLIDIFSAFNGEKKALTAKSFIEGNFDIKNIGQVKNFLIQLEDFKMLDFYKTNPFIKAFLKLSLQESYSHDRMIEKLKTRSFCIKRTNSIDEYLVSLTRNVYSYGRVTDPIFYDINTKKFYK